jgi:hypothetical protein
LNHAELATADTTPTGEALQLEIVRLLSTLLDLVPKVALLADSHQPGLALASVMSFDAREIQNDMIRKERRDLLEATKDGKATGHGTTAAPGNIAALSAYAEIWSTTQHQVWRLTRWLDRRGLSTRLEPLNDQVPVASTTTILHLRLLRPLVWEVTDDKLLTSVLRDLEHAQEVAEHLVDGANMIRLDKAECPHCGRQTLTVDRKAGTITCGKEHATGRRHACVCPDPLCECKAHPISYRHVWHRTRGYKPDGWYSLGGRLNLERLSTKGTDQ